MRNYKTFKEDYDNYRHVITDKIKTKKKEGEKTMVRLSDITMFIRYIIYEKPVKAALYFPLNPYRQCSSSFSD